MSAFFEDGLDIPDLSFYDALTVSTKAFGPRGEKAVRLWQQYNDDYFSGNLKPVPVLFVPTSPFGHWVGLCSGNRATQSVHNIMLLNRPWDTLREVILHEMVHQSLIERGLNPKHEGQPWCDEIMRISKNYFRRDMWAGAVTVIKVMGSDGKRRSVKTNKRSPDNYDSMPYGMITSWPDFTPPDLL